MSRHPRQPSNEPQATDVTRRNVVRAAVSDLVAVVVLSLVAALGIGQGAVWVLKLLGAFVPALAVAWLASRAWRSPAAIKPTGLAVWAATSMVGLAILSIALMTRTNLVLMTITLVVLGILMLGWRFLAASAEKQQSRS